MKDLIQKLLSGSRLFFYFLPDIKKSDNYYDLLTQKADNQIVG